MHCLLLRKNARHAARLPCLLTTYFYGFSSSHSSGPWKPAKSLSPNSSNSDAAFFFMLLVRCGKLSVMYDWWCIGASSGWGTAT
mmetsp:Transcript_80932/g.212450  ORF Transcript_80932/g.212450 Transcript_80932/m.212450 type:complete len:84 (-) Transcript_80932:66-317(-)